MGSVAGPVLVAVLVAALGGGWMEHLDMVPLPDLPADAPTTAEAAGLFGQMVKALEAGDRRALANLTHTYTRFNIPDPLPPAGPDIIRQYAACRIVRPLYFISDDRILYFQFCEAAGERLETFFILKRDSDGKWRILR